MPTKKTTEAPETLYWHWLREDRRLGYGDGREVKVGETLRVDVEPVLCASGLHASPTPLQALQYAPGPVASVVTLGGRVIVGDDKAVAQARTTLWVHDASAILHEFACWCAFEALTNEEKAGRSVDARCWAAIEAKRGWLRGEVTDAQLDAARAAAWDAARAAWDAARAAWDAARAAGDAAWDAAWDAARAAGDAAWARQNEQLTRLLVAAGAPVLPQPDPYEAETVVMGESK